MIELKAAHAAVAEQSRGCAMPAATNWQTTVCKRCAVQLFALAGYEYTFGRMHQTQRSADVEGQQMLGAHSFC